MYSITMRVETETPSKGNQAYADMCHLSVHLQESYPSVHVYADMYEPDEDVEEDEEYSDADTLMKALDAMLSTGIAEDQGVELVKAMQSVGILFREKRVRSETVAEYFDPHDQIKG